MYLVFYSVLSLALACSASQHTGSNHHGSSTLQRPGSPPYSNATEDTPYWLAEIKHQGKAPFHKNGGNRTGDYPIANITGQYPMGNSTEHYAMRNSTGEHKVFRNVKDFGAKGKRNLHHPRWMAMQAVNTLTSIPVLTNLASTTRLALQHNVDRHWLIFLQVTAFPMIQQP